VSKDVTTEIKQDTLRDISRVMSLESSTAVSGSKGYFHVTVATWSSCSTSWCRCESGWEAGAGAGAGAGGAGATEALPRARARHAVAPVLLAPRIFFTRHTSSTLLLCFAMMQKHQFFMQGRYHFVVWSRISICLLGFFRGTHTLTSLAHCIYYTIF
jgi:hypothetical protein